MHKYTLAPHILLILLLFWQPVGAQQAVTDDTWISQQENGERLVHLYFFRSEQCPHCQEARPHLLQLDAEFPWLRVHDLEITRHPEHRRQFQAMADALGQSARSVPSFFVCGQLYVGWDNRQGMGATLVQAAEACRSGHSAAATIAQTQGIQVPWLPDFNWEGLSLPVMTVIIAGLDAFNPCAFFILLFLLSLLVHARSRKRMLLVGMTFVLVSGVVYFLFMAAWLNLFLLLGSLPWITLSAGVLAVLIGLLNTREFFFFHQGPSLSIPDTAKPGLFRRMTGLITIERLPTLLAGTLLLALAVNSYELLCTAGFPMVYTRTLTLHQLSTSGYYGYLLLYNLIYVLPLLLIVVLFTLTLGSRKLSQNEGQWLKLISGVMMLLLGILLIVAPELLNQAQTGVGLLLLALLLALLLGWLKQRWMARRSS